MAVTIKLKNASGSDPSASDLVVGEVALRTDSGKLFTKKDDNSVVQIGGGAGAIDDGAITNAKVASDAAIAGSKISPTFSSNFTATGTEHKFTSGTSGDCELIIEADTDNNNENDNPRLIFRQDGGIDVSCFEQVNNKLTISNSVSSGGISFKTGTSAGYTNATERFSIDKDGTVDVAGNLDVGAGVDVTGNLICSHSSGRIDLNASDGSIEIQRTAGGGFIDFKDSTTEDNDYRIQVNSNGFTMTGTLSSTFSGNLTGNVTGNTSGSSGSCTGNAATATTATNVVGVANSSNTAYRVPFLSADTGTAAVYTDTSSGITYNPSTNTLAAGTFSGSGASLTSLNASNIGSGTLAAARLGTLPATIGLNTSTGGTPNSRNAFLALGDTDTGVAQNGDGQLEFWANNQEIMNLDQNEIIAYKRIEPSADSTHNLGTSSVRWANVYADTLHGDGSNIGSVNAATLDSLDSSQFLRSDASDTMVGNFNLTGNFSLTAELNFLSSSDTSRYIDAQVGTADGTHAFQIRAVTGGDSGHEVMAQFFGGAGVKLFHNGGLAKFETKNYGAFINGHLQMDDNNIIKLGNSNDLQIYHDSSDSIINDSGTGNLKLQLGGSTKFEVTSGGATLTGSLTVSGTVDGRDVASDGSKLDGIASGATNVTNNNQLTNGAGYVTSSGNTVIGTDSDINTSGATVIDQLNMTDGVIQSHSTRTMTLANLGYTGATNANYITNNNQLSNGAGYITSVSGQNYNSLSNKPTIPTNNNQLSNGAGYITSGSDRACRAWVNFRGNSTVVRNDHANVSSVSDNGVGHYTVSFASSMPNSDYCVTIGFMDDAGNSNVAKIVDNSLGTGSFQIRTGSFQDGSGNTDRDFDGVFCAVFAG